MIYLCFCVRQLLILIDSIVRAELCSQGKYNFNIKKLNTINTLDTSNSFFPNILAGDDQQQSFEFDLKNGIQCFSTFTLCCVVYCVINGDASWHAHFANGSKSDKEKSSMLKPFLVCKKRQKINIWISANKGKKNMNRTQSEINTKDKRR